MQDFDKLFKNMKQWVKKIVLFGLLNPLVKFKNSNCITFNIVLKRYVECLNTRTYQTQHWAIFH